VSDVSEIAQLWQRAVAQLFSFLEVAHRNNCEEYVVAGRRAISASRNYLRRAVEWW
jgi:site-specific recombinase XerD